MFIHKFIRSLASSLNRNVLDSEPVQPLPALGSTDIHAQFSNEIYEKYGFQIQPPRERAAMDYLARTPYSEGQHWLQASTFMFQLRLEWKRNQDAGKATPRNQALQSMIQHSRLWSRHTLLNPVFPKSDPTKNKQQEGRMNSVIYASLHNGAVLPGIVFPNRPFSSLRKGLRLPEGRKPRASQIHPALESLLFEKHRHFVHVENTTAHRGTDPLAEHSLPVHHPSSDRSQLAGWMQNGNKLQETFSHLTVSESSLEREHAGIRKGLNTHTFTHNVHPVGFQRVFARFLSSSLLFNTARSLQRHTMEERGQEEKSGHRPMDPVTVHPLRDPRIHSVQTIASESKVLETRDWAETILQAVRPDADSVLSVKSAFNTLQMLQMRWRRPPDYLSTTWFRELSAIRNIRSSQHVNDRFINQILNENESFSIDRERMKRITVSNQRDLWDLRTEWLQTVQENNRNHRDNSNHWDNSNHRNNSNHRSHWDQWNVWDHRDDGNGRSRWDQWISLDHWDRGDHGDHVNGRDQSNDQIRWIDRENNIYRDDKPIRVFRQNEHFRMNRDRWEHGNLWRQRQISRPLEFFFSLVRSQSVNRMNDPGIMRSMNVIKQILRGHVAENETSIDLNTRLSRSPSVMDVLQWSQADSMPFLQLLMESNTSASATTGRRKFSQTVLDHPRPIPVALHQQTGTDRGTQEQTSIWSGMGQSDQTTQFVLERRNTHAFRMPKPSARMWKSTFEIEMTTSGTRDFSSDAFPAVTQAVSRLLTYASFHLLHSLHRQHDEQRDQQHNRQHRGPSLSSVRPIVNGAVATRELAGNRTIQVHNMSRSALLQQVFNPARLTRWKEETFSLIKRLQAGWDDLGWPEALPEPERNISTGSIMSRSLGLVSPVSQTSAFWGALPFISGASQSMPLQSLPTWTSFPTLQPWQPMTFRVVNQTNRLHANAQIDEPPLANGQENLTFQRQVSDHADTSMRHRVENAHRKLQPEMRTAQHVYIPKYMPNRLLNRLRFLPLLHAPHRDLHDLGHDKRMAADALTRVSINEINEINRISNRFLKQNDSLHAQSASQSHSNINNRSRQAHEGATRHLNQVQLWNPMVQRNLWHPDWNRQDQLRRADILSPNLHNRTVVQRIQQQDQRWPLRINEWQSKHASIRESDRKRERESQNERKSESGNVISFSRVFQTHTGMSDMSWRQVAESRLHPLRAAGSAIGDLNRRDAQGKGTAQLMWNLHETRPIGRSPSQLQQLANPVIHLHEEILHRTQLFGQDGMRLRQAGNDSSSMDTTHVQVNATSLHARSEQQTRANPSLTILQKTADPATRKEAATVSPSTLHRKAPMEHASKPKPTAATIDTKQINQRFKEVDDRLEKVVQMSEKMDQFNIRKLADEVYRTLGKRMRFDQQRRGF
ncbi:hypothetical protein [Marinicrinis sediminis]|uniref:Uncharacterized protein n=1 Tax=Marinicrinis sediminis TaxID=1652465 RepID=A0ABW5RET5_9BACL